MCVLTWTIRMHATGPAPSGSHVVPGVCKDVHARLPYVHSVPLPSYALMKRAVCVIYIRVMVVVGLAGAWIFASTWGMRLMRVVAQVCNEIYPS